MPVNQFEGDRASNLRRTVGLGLFLLVAAAVRMTDRNHFWQWYMIYGAVAVLAGFWWYYRKGASIGELILTAVVIRLTFGNSLPILSDDFCRFLWDGRMWQLGYNPFAVLPGQWAAMHANLLTAQDQFLLSHMNSVDYYTVYPPLNQFLFWLAALVYGHFGLGGGVLVLRSAILVGDVFSIIAVYKLAGKGERGISLASLWALNPLLIFEGVGNLHFEPLMMCFLLWGILVYRENKPALSGAAFVLSALSKLQVILLFPLLFFRKPGKKLLHWIATGFSLALIFFLMLPPSLWKNFGTSLDLYFQKFEFNASIYSLLDAWGTHIKGYNPIHTIGPFLSVVAALVILFLAIKYRKCDERTFFRVATISWTAYLLLSTTVHPWYVLPLVPLGLLAGLRYPLIWSVAAFLSYRFYSAPDMFPWYTWVEYAAVFGGMIWDWKRSRAGSRELEDGRWKLTIPEYG